jgi:hypothetical protein
MDKSEVNPESLDWTVGHIHSHNTMGVFFSGTDWDELNDNAANFNYYLSVIVNNKFEITANLATIGTQESIYTIRNDNGEDYRMKVNGLDKKVLFYYECSVPDMQEKMEQLPEIDDRITELAIKEEQEEARKKASNGSTGSKEQYTGPAKDWVEQNDYKSVRNQVKSQKGGQYDKYPATQKEREFLNRSVKNNSDLESDMSVLESKEFLFKEDRTETEKLLSYILSLGDYPVFSSVQERLNMWDNSFISLEPIIEIIKDNIEAWYDSWFENEKDMQTHESYLETLALMHKKLLSFYKYDCAEKFAQAMTEAAQDYIDYYQIDLSKIEQHASNNS